MKPNPNRREFIRATTAATASVALAPSVLRAAGTAQNDKMIGMQIGAVSFVDEGTEPVLDSAQQRNLP